MKLESESNIKALMKTGQAFSMYANKGDIELLKKRMMRVRDDGNDVYVNPDHISIFEVLDDRQHPPSIE